MKRVIGNVVAGLAAISLAATPALAAQSPASKLSLRNATTAGNHEQLAGTMLAIIGAVVVAGVIAVVVAVDDDDDADSP